MLFPIILPVSAIAAVTRHITTTTAVSFHTKRGESSGACSSVDEVSDMECQCFRCVPVWDICGGMALA
jgi:hypothetical protein